MDGTRLEHFEPLVGSSFALQAAPGVMLDTELVEARALPMPPFAGRQPFSLLFRGPSVPRLPQRIYPLTHQALPALEVFLVPVGADGNGTRYQAVFA